MTNAPYLLPGARAGYRLGDQSVVDSLMHDGLFCAFDACSMGEGTERYNRDRSNRADGHEPLSREAMDRFAALSHERAAAAHKEGRLDAELLPVEVPQRRGDPIVVDADEGVRPGTTVESLAGLRPAFASDGLLTAGQRLTDLRWGVGHGDHERGQGRGARADPARRDRVVRRGRRAIRPCCRSRPRRPGWPSTGPDCRSTTSTCGRSTRPSRRWCCRAWPTWAWTARNREQRGQRQRWWDLDGAPDRGLG